MNNNSHHINLISGPRRKNGRNRPSKPPQFFPNKPRLPVLGPMAPCLRRRPHLISNYSLNSRWSSGGEACANYLTPIYSNTSDGHSLNAYYYVGTAVWCFVVVHEEWKVLGVREGCWVARLRARSCLRVGNFGSFFLLW